MLKILVMSMLIGINTIGTNPIKTADVVTTYDNTMVIEYQDGTIEKHFFKGMTEKEMYAEKVAVFNDKVVVIK